MWWLHGDSGLGNDLDPAFVARMAVARVKVSSDFRYPRMTLGTHSQHPEPMTTQPLTILVEIPSTHLGSLDRVVHVLLEFRESLNPSLRNRKRKGRWLISITWCPPESAAVGLGTARF